MSIDPKKLSVAIRELREATSPNQKIFAAKIGIGGGDQSVSKYEHGQRPHPRFLNAMKALALEVGRNDLAQIFLLAMEKTLGGGSSHMSDARSTPTEVLELGPEIAREYPNLGQIWKTAPLGIKREVVEHFLDRVERERVVSGEASGDQTAEEEGRGAPGVVRRVAGSKKRIKDIPKRKRRTEEEDPGAVAGGSSS